MFTSSIKTKLAVATVVVAGAFAVPAMASAAPLWHDNGVAVSSSEAIHGAGTLTLSVAGGAFTTTCNVTDTGTVGAAGVDSVSTFVFSGCTTNIAGCTVTSAVANSLPWSSLLVTGPKDQISGISFTNTYAGTTCPATGAVNATGTLSPSVTNTATGVNLVFNASAGTLTTPFGAATVTGTASQLLNAAGHVLSAS
jgi:hypothetical protein